MNMNPNTKQITFDEAFDILRSHYAEQLSYTLFGFLKLIHDYGKEFYKAPQVNSVFPESEVKAVLEQYKPLLVAVDLWDVELLFFDNTKANLRELFIDTTYGTKPPGNEKLN